MKVYSWSELPPEEARAGVVRRAFANSDVMVVHHFLHPGMETRPHVHDFDQMVCVIDGEVFFTVEGKRHRTRTGDVFNIPAGAVHFAEVPGDRIVTTLDIFAPPRKDYSHLVSYLEQAD
ncbi:MAG: cupin domain-containing protein [Bacillota bacterium]|nr:MAG: cupin domain-containing protein [Bacillota bacterium]